MKIGILTLRFHTNYGGIMQAYALQTVLEKMGHQPSILDVLYWGKKKHSIIFLHFYKIILWIYKSVSSDFSERKKINMFIKENIKQRSFYSFYDIKEEDYDAIIVGSDQIWRELFIPKIENVFLDFSYNWDVKRISYAASFGTDKWSYSVAQTNTCKTLLSKFDYVSVRESSGVKLLRDYMGVDSKLVLDPTLLLSSEDYYKILKIDTRKKTGMMLTYILNETEQAKSISKAIAKEKKLQNNFIYPERHYLKRLPSVEDWLKSIIEADFIFTDSFHVSIFSIIFGKSFLFLRNEISGNTRIDSLFSLLGIQNRALPENIDINEAIIASRKTGPIGESINPILIELKKESIQFLKKALN